METWRLVASVLTALIGLGLVLGAMSQVRDNRHRHGGSVARTGVLGLSTLAVVNTLVATLLPATLCWALVVGGALLLSVLMITG